MLTAEQNDELTQVGPGTPDGRAAAPLLVPGRLHPRARRVPGRARRFGCSARTGRCTRRPPAGTASSARPARTAGRRWPTAWWRPTASAARTTAGCSASTASASSSPPSATRPTSGTGSGPGPGQAQEMGGLVWAYVGPGPAPELPRFDVFVMDGVRDIGWADLPCNCVQIMENAVDPHHVEWLHGRYFEFMGKTPGLRGADVVREEAHQGRLRRVRVGHHQAPGGRGRHRGGRRLGGRPPAGVPVQHARRRGEHRPDADPRADRPTRPRGSCSTPCTTPRAATWEKQADRSCTTTRSRTRTASSSPTTSRARTSWPG